MTSFSITLTSSDITLTVPVNVSLERTQIKGLEPNTSYRVSIQLGNEFGITTEDIVIATSRGPPAKPSKPVIDHVLVNSVQLTFSINSIGSEPLTRYLVNVSNEQGQLIFVHTTSVITQPRPGDNISLTVNGLAGGSVYTFAVAGDTNIGTGSYSDYSDVITTS